MRRRERERDAEMERWMDGERNAYVRSTARRKADRAGLPPENMLFFNLITRRHQRQLLVGLFTPHRHAHASACGTVPSKVSQRR